MAVRLGNVGGCESARERGRRFKIMGTGSTRECRRPISMLDQLSDKDGVST
jgi:hypothetical protein